MKKLLIGVVLFLSIVIVAKQFISDTYSSATKLADTGDYKGFYAEIKNDENAKELLTEYFLKAVDDENVEAVKYYLAQDRNIINSSINNGMRAMDLILIEENKINVDFVKLLLSYKPELKYEIYYDKERYTFSEKASIHCAAVKNGAEVITLLLEAGMNPNLITDAQNGHSKYPPLYTSYRFNNFEVFEKLLKHTSNINPIVVTDKHEDSLIQFMMNEYLKVIEENGAKLELPSAGLLSETIRSLKYRHVHNNNMRYFRSMVKAGLIEKISEKEVEKIFVYLASTGEIDSTKLFVDNGVCKKYQRLCDIASHAAKKYKYDEIESIIE